MSILIIFLVCVSLTCLTVLVMELIDKDGSCITCDYYQGGACATSRILSYFPADPSTGAGSYWKDPQLAFCSDYKEKKV